MAADGTMPYAYIGTERAAENYRQAILTDSTYDISNLAWKAINELDLENNEFVIACIQVDSEWKNLVNKLLPDADWQSARDRHEEPIACLTINWKMTELLSQKYPEQANEISEVPDKGNAKIFILAGGGVTISTIPIPSVKPAI